MTYIQRDRQTNHATTGGIAFSEALPFPDDDCDNDDCPDDDWTRCLVCVLLS